MATQNLRCNLSSLSSLLCPYSRGLRPFKQIPAYQHTLKKPPNQHSKIWLKIKPDNIGLMRYAPAMMFRKPVEIQPVKGIHTSKPLGFHEDTETKSVTVWTNLKAVSSSPVPALALGLSGLIPFIAAPGFMLLSQTYSPFIASAQLAYGASILSFLGGVRWGFTLPEQNPVQPDWENLTYSVVPSLVAWTGLMMPWQGLGICTVMAGMGFVAYYDLAMYGYPTWFKGLRFLLSLVALLCLWSTLMCSFILKQKQIKPVSQESSVKKLREIKPITKSEAQPNKKDI